MEESHFPSMSNEKSGWYVGVLEHVGHILMFMILAVDIQKIIHQSIIQTATDPSLENLQANRPSDQEPYQYIQLYIDDNV